MVNSEENACALVMLFEDHRIPDRMAQQIHQVLALEELQHQVEDLEIDETDHEIHLRHT